MVVLSWAENKKARKSMSYVLLNRCETLGCGGEGFIDNVYKDKIIVGKGKPAGRGFDGEFGVVDYSGKEILPVKYESIAYLYGNLFSVTKEGTKPIVIDASTKKSFTELNLSEKPLIKKDNTCPSDFRRVRNAHVGVPYFRSVD